MTFLLYPVCIIIYYFIVSYESTDWVIPPSMVDWALSTVIDTTVIKLTLQSFESGALLSNSNIEHDPFRLSLTASFVWFITPIQCFKPVRLLALHYLIRQ